MRTWKLFIAVALVLVPTAVSANGLPRLGGRVRSTAAARNAYEYGRTRNPAGHLHGTASRAPSGHAALAARASDSLSIHMRGAPRARELVVVGLGRTSASAIVGHLWSTPPTESFSVTLRSANLTSRERVSLVSSQWLRIKDLPLSRVEKRAIRRIAASDSIHFSKDGGRIESITGTGPHGEFLLDHAGNGLIHMARFFKRVNGEWKRVAAEPVGGGARLLAQAEAVQGKRPSAELVALRRVARRAAARELKAEAASE